MNIKQYSFEDFTKLKKAGEITAQALDFVTDKIKPGITTNIIDKIVSDFLKSKQATCAPLFYKGFPKSICTSVNAFSTISIVCLERFPSAYSTPSVISKSFCSICKALKSKVS